MGAFGLQIFFLLSAFLIFSLLLREREATGTIHLRNFAIRRVLRIWPLAFLAIAAGYLLGLLYHPMHMSIPEALAFAFMGGNLYILLHGWIYQPIGILWSLSAEEQFYLFVPALTRSISTRALQAICWTFVAISYLALIHIGRHHQSPNPDAFVNPLVTFQFFALGGLLAIHLKSRPWTPSLRTRTILLALGLLLFWFAAYHGHLQDSFPSTVRMLLRGYLALAPGCIAVFLAFFNYPGSIPKPLAYFGKISYGLYVFHSWFLHIAFPLHWQTASFLVRLTFDVTALALTIATASLSYRFFEAPILRLKNRYEIIPTKPV